MHWTAIVVTAMGIIIIVLCCVPLFSVGIFSAVVGGGLSYTPEEIRDLLGKGNTTISRSFNNLTQDAEQALSNYIEGTSSLFVAVGIIFLILAFFFLIGAVFGFCGAKKSSKGLILVNVITNSFICIILFIAIIWVIVEFAHYSTLDALVGDLPIGIIVVAVLPEFLLLLSLIASAVWLKLHSETSKM
eukprot:TRINITY_DN5355_c0_g1_i1.p1 TRINITY_DN5355_c0_g1~~TRINITY_DN5355_c0_g1_i1.p1  ORF type:complete len:188 (-),score=32.03 TRINITY_DN5355_c0_g1_i1:154-717(-)